MNEPTPAYSTDRLNVVSNLAAEFGFKPPLGATTAKYLTTQRGRLCNERARVAKEIEALKLIHAAIDAGIQALEVQIASSVDKPPAV